MYYRQLFPDIDAKAALDGPDTPKAATAPSGHDALMLRRLHDELDARFQAEFTRPPSELQQEMVERDDLHGFKDLVSLRLGNTDTVLLHLVEQVSAGCVARGNLLQICLDEVRTALASALQLAAQLHRGLCARDNRRELFFRAIRAIMLVALGEGGPSHKALHEALEALRGELMDHITKHPDIGLQGRQKHGRKSAGHDDDKEREGEPLNELDSLRGLEDMLSTLALSSRSKRGAIGGDAGVDVEELTMPSNEPLNADGLVKVMERQNEETAKGRADLERMLATCVRGMQQRGRPLLVPPY